MVGDNYSIEKKEKWGRRDSNSDQKLTSRKMFIIAFQLKFPLLEAPILDSAYKRHF